MLGALQIRNRPGDFENAVVHARSQSLLLHCSFQEPLSIRAQFAVDADLPRGHLCIGINFIAGLPEAHPLQFPRRDYPSANLRRALGCFPTAQLLVLHGGDLNMNFDAVKQRPGDLGHVPLDHGRVHMHSRDLSLKNPHGQGFMAAASMKRAGKLSDIEARSLVTV
jgi:hypothetical protein